MNPRLSNDRSPGFARMPPPGHHSGEVPQSQPPPQPPHDQQQQLTTETHPPHLGRNIHPQEAAYRAKGDLPKNRSRRMKGLNLIQVASTNPVPRCRHLASQIALEEITFWTNACNMWLLDKKQNQQLEHGEQGGGGGGGGGGERMMDMGSLALDALTGQEYYYDNNNNNNNSPSYGLHGEAATTDQPARMYYNHHHPPPPPPPPPRPTSTTTTTHSNGVEAIRAALNHNFYEDPTMPISIAATVGPPHPQTSFSAHNHNHHHHHPDYPSPWMMQSQPTHPPAATTRRTADYNNNPYATMPRRGGRRDWRGQVPRPAGLQTRAEREFNGVDVYGRYKPDA